MKRDRVICILAFAAAATVLAPRTYSQEKKEAGDTHKIVHFGDLKWTPIIKGCDLASVAGDSSAEGAPFVVRIRCTSLCASAARMAPRFRRIGIPRMKT